MKIFSANVKSLTELYNSELRKALDLEEQGLKALPINIAKAADAQLKQVFQSHLQESELHVTKVRELLAQLPETSSQTCKIASALSSEAQDTIKDVNDPDVLDVALIGIAQQAEHHEIAVYGTLKNWARLLGRTSDYAVLESIENEEKHADKLLSTVAERVNSEAQAVAA